MKLKTVLFSLIAVGFSLTLPSAYASDAPPAPVEDLSMEQSPTDGPSSVNSADAAQYSDQGQASDPNQQMSPNVNAEQNQTPGDHLNPSNATSDERIARLEQQMKNMTNMNMSQQIDTLRQEVQQLNGRIQVQQHEIKALEDQQRAQKLQPKTENINKTSSANPSSNDASAYRSAFNLLRKKQYDDALSAFQDYISQHPKGRFISNAYYWMGELYLKRQDTKMGTESFEQILSKYPSSNKVPDAKFKLAIIHMNQGKKVQARRELQAIKRQFPNSTVAQLASIQLQRMKQQ